MANSDVPLSQSELAAFADHLRALLDSIQADAFEATAATRYRLEGAIAALDVAMGRPSTLLDDVPPIPG